MHIRRSHFVAVGFMLLLAPLSCGKDANGDGPGDPAAGDASQGDDAHSSYDGSAPDGTGDSGAPSDASDAGDAGPPSPPTAVNLLPGVTAVNDSSMVIDETNKKLLVVALRVGTSGSSDTPILVRCNLDGTSCAIVDISAGHKTGCANFNCGFSIRAVLDTVNAKLLVVHLTPGALKPGLFRCNLDGSNCAFIDISAGQGSYSDHPSAMIDQANGKLLVTTAIGQDPNAKAGLFRCNLDGTSCSFVDISAGQPPGSGSLPEALIDAANSKLLVVASNQGKPALFRSNLDGTSASYVDLSAGQAAAVKGGSAAIDGVNRKLLVVTSTAGGPLLLRCDLNGTACSQAVDISVGHASWFALRPLVDAAHGKLLVVGMAGPSNTVARLRCNLDGTGCTYLDMSAGQKNLSGYRPSPAIDAAGWKLFVAAENFSPGANGWLWLYSAGTTF